MREGKCSAAELNSFLIPLGPRTRRKESDASRNFCDKKTRSVFCNAARKKRRRASRRDPDESGFARRPTPEAKPTLPPALNGSMYPRRFETGRPLRAVALSNHPSSCYGLAGGRPGRGGFRRRRAIAPLSAAHRRLVMMTAMMMLGGWRSLPAPPCSLQPPALPCSPQPRALPQELERKPASPTRWRRKLRRGLKGCASYCWISLIWAARNGPQRDY